MADGLAMAVAEQKSIDLTARMQDTTTQPNWLSYTHDEYETYHERWLYAKRHYTGDVNDTAWVKQFLIRKKIGETQVAYDERCQLADYTGHFGAIVDSIAGMLFAVEGSANRVYDLVTPGERGSDGAKVTKILGSPANAEDPIGRMYLDADGSGTGYLSKWKELATELLVVHLAWVMVDPDDGNPKLKIFPATSVTNWHYDEDGLSTVLIKEEVDVRTSIREPIKREAQYLELRRDGWTRWRAGQNGPEKVTGRANDGTWAFYDRSGRRVPPIFPVRLPLKRQVGWQLAKKANAIFNRESDRDNLLRVANFPKLNLIATDEQFAKLAEALVEGHNALQNDPTITGKAHHYIAPDTGPATVASEVLKRKVEEYYVSAFRMYEDSAREKQKSATEASQDVSMGVAAFLQLLKAAVDDAENTALSLITQALYPDKKNYWFVPRVARSDEFVPTDVEKAIRSLQERYFGTAVPVATGRTAMISAAKQILEWDGVQYDEVELAAAVDLLIAARAVEGVGDKVTLPADAQVMLLGALLTAMAQVKERPAADGEGILAGAEAAIKEQEQAERDLAKNEAKAAGQPKPAAKPVAGE